MGAERVVLDMARRQGDKGAQAPPATRQGNATRQLSLSATRQLSHRELREIQLVLKEVWGKEAQAREFLGHRAAPVSGRLQSPRRARTRPNKEVELQEQDECCQERLQEAEKNGSGIKKNGSGIF